MTLTFRISLLVSLLSSVIILITAVVFTAVFHYTSERQIHRDLEKKTSLIQTEHITFNKNDIFYKRGKNGETISSRLRDLELSAIIYNTKLEKTGVYGIYGISADAALFTKDPLNQVLSANAPLHTTAILADGRNYDTYTVPLVYAGQTYGLIQTAKETESVNNLLSNSVLVLFFIIPISILLVWVTVYKSVKTTVNPLTQLINSMENFSLAVPLKNRPETGSDTREIRRLTRTYTEMLGKISEGVAKQQTFIHNASHELKRPLTHAVNAIDLALISMNDGDMRKTAEKINKTKKDLLDLDNTLENLLTLAEINQTLPVGNIKTFNPYSIILDIIGTYENDIARNDLRINNLVKPQYTIRFPKNVFGIIARNLIVNSIKYNQLHGSVTLEFLTVRKAEFFRISDTGVGMDQTTRQNMFERFYRGYHPADLPGSGLGMSIVKEMCTLYNLQIRVESRIGHGTIITLGPFPEPD
jgi:signal transduction histidine kinase